jgi:hypothetical protein
VGLVSFGSNQVLIFTFWPLKLGVTTVRAGQNAFHATNKIEIAFHAWKLDLQPHYAITGGPDYQIRQFWVKSCSRFYFLNVETRQKLFSCWKKCMSCKQKIELALHACNLTSQPHYAMTGWSNWAVLGQIRFAFLLFDPWNSVWPLFVLKEMHFIRTQNWISSPRLKVISPASLRDFRWAVLAQIRFAFLLFEPWNSVKAVFMLKEMHVMQTKIQVALHAWNLTSQPQYAITGGRNCQIGILSQIRYAHLLFEPWNSVKAVFMLNEMHVMQITNWISSPRLRGLFPVALRDFRWAKLPNWAVWVKSGSRV